MCAQGSVSQEDKFAGAPSCKCASVLVAEAGESADLCLSHVESHKLLLN